MLGCLVRSVPDLSDDSSQTAGAEEELAVVGRILVEAAGPPDVLRTVQFARGETEEGLDMAAPVVVEGVLVVIQHPARGEFRAVGFLALFGLMLKVRRDRSRPRGP